MIVLEPGLRSRLGGVAIVVALTTAGIVFFGVGTGPRALSPPTVSGVPSTSSPETATVHVSGAVADPGLVEVATGARTADAIAAAGGTIRGADLSAINLAAPVRNGDQLVVPVRPAAAESGPGGPPPSDPRVRINYAAAAELESLPGVGPVLAQRIVEHRELHGPFTEVEDLLDVPGIGEAKLATLRESVIVP